MHKVDASESHVHKARPNVFLSLPVLTKQLLLAKLPCRGRVPLAAAGVRTSDSSAERRERGEIPISASTDRTLQ